ncbi:uncharacterized protein A4U43_C05F20660 [Asparagus officinalis]|uniref:Fiber protein Fb11 n=1 Tax=Asparagus officinalis TaxID=4686 RepID=A0A5P1EVN6_ASPOF|nr:uncharacterized protein A4U43_C05F20660 [Asparagus officinalis]
MGVMDKLKVFVVKEPVVAASCLIAGFGLFLPAVVRPILDSFETAKEVPQPALRDIVNLHARLTSAALQDMGKTVFYVWVLNGSMIADPQV